MVYHYIVQLNWVRYDHTRSHEVKERDMGRTKNQGKSAMRVAIYILLITWIILLVLLAAIYMLRLKGYNSFKEWQDRNNIQEVLKPGIVNPSPTKIVVPTNTPALTNTPEPTATAVPTDEPEPTVTSKPTATPAPTNTSVPTATPTPTGTPTPAVTLPPVYTMEFSGNKKVDEQLRRQAEKIFGTEEDVCYASSANGIYFSVVFQRENTIYPVVYNLDTAEQVTGSDLIKDTYFAIVKERLQEYVKTSFPEEAEDDFVSYDQIYQAEDYQKFYMTKDKLVFCFDAGTLSANHPAFTYACDLEEAKAFFKNNLDGTANGPGIRKLNPNAKMIAITFDDGPYPKVEQQIIDLFAKYNGRATFFFLGQRVDDWYEEMPGIAYAAGHEVGSHTYSHELDFSNASNREIWSEINATNLSIAKSTGYAPEYIRFPGGSAGKRSLEVPMFVVNWNMDSMDYKYKKQSDGAEVIYKRLLNSMVSAEDGGIVLMHSIYQNSFDAVEKFVKYLVQEGYELVTLSELFYYKGVTPETGVVYQAGDGSISKKK